MQRKRFEFTKTIPAGISSTSAAPFDEQRRSHSTLSGGLLKVEEMEFLLLSVAIVGTSAGSILVGHAILRLIRSKTVAGNDSDPNYSEANPNLSFTRHWV